MSNAMIGFLFAVGFSAWLYARMQRSTGGNTKSSVIVAACSGLIAFLFITIVLGMIF